MSYLCAVDADIIAFRVAAACEEESEERLEDTIRAAIYDLWKETKAKNYLFALTGDGNYRYDVATIKPYKGNRANKTRPRHLSRARAYIVEAYNGLIVDGVEGDDVVVSAAHRYRLYDTIIASTDKDLKQYPAWHYNIVKKELYKITPQEADFLLWKQVLTGDSTDNIGGLPNVGPVKAENWLRECIQKEIPLPSGAWMMYKENGYDYAFFQENLDLIRMRTDVYIPYEEHFVQLEFKKEDSDDLDFD